MRRLCCALALVLAACGGAPAAPAARIDTVGGIVRVTNPDSAPALPWRWVEEPAIAPAADAPGALGSVDGLALADDGTLFAIQSGPTVVRVFGPDGAHRRDIGRDGEGPGEFQVGNIAVHGDTLALQDPGLSRLTLFHVPDGKVIATTPSLCCWATSFLDLDDAGRVAVPGAAESGGGIFVRFDLAGRALDTLTVPDEPKSTVEWNASWKSAEGGGFDMKIPGPLQPSQRMRYRGDGLLVYGSTGDSILVLSRTGRDTVRILTMPLPRVTISAAQRDSVFQAQLDGMRWQREWLKKGSPADVPATWPGWQGLLVDRSHRLWVGVPGPRGALDHALVFASDGVLLGRVDLPHPGFFGGTWGRDRIALVDDGGDDGTRIRIFRLDTAVVR